MSNSSPSRFWTFVTGAAVGAGYVMLNTKRTGIENRERLSRYVDENRDRAQRLVDEQRTRAERLPDALKAAGVAAKDAFETNVKQPTGTETLATTPTTATVPGGTVTGGAGNSGGKVKASGMSASAPKTRS